MKVSTTSRTASGTNAPTGTRSQQVWTFARFVAMGLTTSLTYGLLFLALRAITTWSDVTINVAATVISTALGNELHRRFTFRSTVAGSTIRGHSAGTGTALFGLAANSLAVGGWTALFPGANAVATLAVVYCVNGLVGLANFVVFRRTLTGSPRPAEGFVAPLAAGFHAGLQVATRQVHRTAHRSAGLLRAARDVPA